jgi:hypothetical protein
MRLDLERVRANVHRSSTEDLLDRATVYRAEMEEAALILIDEELRQRGITSADVADHEAQRRQQMVVEGGLPRKCWKCRRPAVGSAWGWHRLWGLIPLFPRRLRFCAEHQPRREASERPG